MKKSLKLIGAVSLSLLCLTGCGGSGNKLVCTSTEDRLTEEITFTFDGDDVKSVKMVYTSKKDSKEDAEEHKDYLATLLSLSYGTPEASGYNYDVKISGSDIIGTITFDNTDKTSELMSNITSGKTKEDIKSDLEANGSTCK